MSEADVASLTRLIAELSPERTAVMHLLVHAVARNDYALRDRLGAYYRNDFPEGEPILVSADVLALLSHLPRCAEHHSEVVAWGRVILRAAERGDGAALAELEGMVRQRVAH